MEFGLFTVFDNYKYIIDRTPGQLFEQVLEQTAYADQLGYHSVWYAEHEALRFNDALTVIEKAWSGEKFSHAGRYYQFSGVKLEVLPKQKKVPVWIGTLSQRGSEFVAKMGYNIMGVAYVASHSLKELKEIIDNYKRIYRESGHDENKLKIPIAVHTFVAETREEAKKISKKHVNLYLDTRLYGRNAKFEDLEKREHLLIGSPDDVVKRLKKYQEAGCDHIMMLMNFGGIPHQEVLRSMELVAREVMPRFLKE